MTCSCGHMFYEGKKKCHCGKMCCLCNVYKHYAVSETSGDNLQKPSVNSLATFQSHLSALEFPKETDLLTVFYKQRITKAEVVTQEVQQTARTHGCQSFPFVLKMQLSSSERQMFRKQIQREVLYPVVPSPKGRNG